MSGGSPDYTPTPTPTSVKPTGGGGGDGPPQDDVCGRPHTAPLNSPKPAVVSRLSKGDILDVVLDRSSGRPIVIVRTKAGEVAGSLTHREHTILIGCVDAGNTYEATVIDKVGGSVTVHVERT